MNRICASVCLAASMTMALACGGNVVVDGSSPGTGGAPVACPGTALFIDSQVTSLVGKPCMNVDEVCSDNNGCGGCSVTCKNGVWTSTNADLCVAIGGTC